MNIGIINLITRTAIINALLLLAASAIFGQSVLVADSYTSLTSANGNFGSNPSLTVSANNAAYVKFDFEHFLLAGTRADDISKATVKFYVSKVGTAGKLDLYPVLADWDEKTISANNAPAIGQLALTTPQIGKDAQGNYMVFDITNLFKQWLGDGQNALPNYGFALAPHPVDSNTPQLIDISLDSKENSQTSHDAVLAIQFKKAETGLQTVSTDTTLTGDGTQQNPLGVAPNAISTPYLADGAVTNAKLATGAVETAKIADGAVTSPKLADGSVGSSKIVVPLTLSSADANATLSVVNTGTGAALNAQGAINTSKQFNINDQRVLSNVGTNNLFAGVGAGQNNGVGNNNAFFGAEAGLNNGVGKFNSFFGSGAGRANLGGDNNTFVGSSAGLSNTGGFQNSFFGREAGMSNTGGSFNSFFGRSAGLNNTTGGANSFFGQDAGINNTTGGANAFFGNTSGGANTTGGGNSFFGVQAGQFNTTGGNNSFFGVFAGDKNKTGSFNTALGWGANFGADNLINASAIGAGAFVSQSNSLVLGGISGVNGGANTFVGIGTTAPRTKLQVTNGKIYIEANGQGMILKSPNGSCFEMTVTDAGALTAAPIACP